MNSINETLLEAFSTVVDTKIKDLAYDKTIQAEITKIIDVNTGEYKAKYNGNVFSVYSNDLSYWYKVGTRVLVKVPEGDFSNKKTIENTVTSKSLSDEEAAATSNQVIEVGPNLDAFYSYDSVADYGVIAAGERSEALLTEAIAQVNADSSLTPAEKEEQITALEKQYPLNKDEVYIYQGPDSYSSNQYHNLFQLYANNYEYLKIEGAFSTALKGTHDTGNYGLELEFFAKNGEGEPTVISYRLDFNMFIGDPYRYNNYSTQSAIVLIQKNYLLGLKSIKLFQENFDYDSYEEYGVNEETGEAETLYKQNTSIENIFVKDISIRYVEILTAADSLYYLTIQAPQGNTFIEKVTSLRLEGKLVYQAQSLIDESTCQCYWYVRDLSVMVGGTEYDKTAGFGWRRITDKSIVDFNVLTLDKKQITYQQDYKLIVVYNDSVTTSAEITIKNYDSDYACKIEQVTTDEDIKLQITNSKNDKVLVGNWYKSMPDGSYVAVEGGEKQSSILVKDYLVYSYINFYCEVYDYEQNELIGVLYHTIYNSETKEDITITYIGEDTYRYDANGDITIEDSEKERTLLISLAWREGYGTSYIVKWLGPDGNEMKAGEAKYSPSQSMISNLWIDNNSILHYTIKLKYKINYNNNTITLKIITLDEKEYVFEKEIVFTKDGDLGTNGTTYVAAIRPCSSDGSKLSGFNPLIYNGTWKNYLNMRVYVYKDGILINPDTPTDDSKNYSIKYEWEGNCVSLSATDKPQILVSGASAVSLNSSAINLAFYVKVLVTITDDINSNKTIVYPNYPIDVMVGNLNLLLVDITDIPSYIKYTSSGTNPSYYSNAISFLYNNINYTANISSCDDSILKIYVNDEGNYYLRPASKFLFEENTIGVLRCVVSSSSYIIHPVFMFLDTYGNEAINGWDGTSLKLNEEDGYILAPLIGAGEKDEGNTFTGVVMGKDTSQNQIGLYGYEKGVNTFGLKEDGTAFFGAYDNGRISIDGTSSTIYGGMTRNANNSMTLILNAKNISESTNAISIKGSANSPLFSVNYKGELNAQSATIKGNITATTLTATESGKIAGFTINGSKLEGGSIECSYLKASSTGEIGGWVIGPNSLTSSAKEENGTPMVTLSSAGSITCNNLTANKSGTIAGWKIFGVSTIDSESGETTTKGYLKGDNISLDSSGGSIIFYAGSVCGYIGKLAGSNAGGETTNLGVRSYGSAGLLLETPLGLNVRISGKDGNFNQGLYIYSRKINLGQDGSEGNTNIYLKGAVEASSTFSVDKAFTAKDAASVEGGLTVKTNKTGDSVYALSVTGATNLTSTLTVGGKVTANGALDVKGATTCVALTASGKITGDGGIGCTTLSASSTITANSGISLTGTLSGGNITSALVPTGKVDFSNAASQTGIHAVFA